MHRPPYAALPLIVLGIAACQAEHPAAGTWQSTIRGTENDMTLAINDGVATGTLRSRRNNNVMVVQVSGSAPADSVALTLTAPGELEAASLDASVRGDSLTGVMRFDGRQLPVTFHRAKE